MRIPVIPLAALWFVLAPFSVDAVAEEPAEVIAEPADVELFESKIRPVLVKHCYSCHSAGAKDLKGGLLLDHRDGLRKGGESGPAVVPGKVEESLLVDALKYDGFEMPPKGKLPDSVIADFETWIRNGAADPRTEKIAAKSQKLDLKAARSYWSFQPPKLVEPARLKDVQWSRTRIDQYILARLQQNQLHPVADAERATLLRRVYFDLVGLPPTVAQLDEFLADQSEEALAKVVDWLLGSPQFGERWGRHWLDVARYSESNGRDHNVIHRHAWRYRDYVIDAFSADKPFDRFLQEQIAGDLLPSDNVEQHDEQIIATGFLAIGPKSYEEGAKLDKFYMELIDEQIDVMSRAILGLTISCARCHDHKYDPVPTSEYYALAGVFRSTETLYGPGTLHSGAKKPSIFQPIGKDVEKLLGPAAEHDKKLSVARTNRGKWASDRYRVVKKRNPLINQKQARQKALEETEDPAEQAKLTAELAELEKMIEPLDKEIAEWDVKIQAEKDIIKMLEDNPPPQPDYAMAVRDREAPQDCKICVRGEFNKLGDQVSRGVLKSISTGELPEITEKESGRLQLARWLSSPENPLTSRVAVNRIWQHLFGRGLVPTVDNFGANGEKPSHPELLDYLALRFQEQGWSVKKMIREIVLSRVYGLSSQADLANRKRDEDNRLLGRMNYRRLEVEPLRDAILSVSGGLDLNRPSGTKITLSELTGSDTIKLTVPEQFNTNTRTVYLPVARSLLPEMLKLFDFADPNMVIGRRDQRTMASQAMYLMNSPFAVEHAQASARRLLSDAELDTPGRIALAYRRFFSRVPTETELKAAAEFIRQSEAENLRRADSQAKDATQAESFKSLDAWTAFCQVLLASAEFRYLE
jgi:hypothetical protein